MSRKKKVRRNNCVNFKLQSAETKSEGNYGHAAAFPSLFPFAFISAEKKGGIREIVRKREAGGPSQGPLGIRDEARVRVKEDT